MTTKIKESPALIIRKLLAIYETTPAELARTIGVHRATVLRLIKGDITRIKEKYLEVIAEYFSLTIEQLKGLKPIYWENVKGAISFQMGKRVPICSWQLKENQLVQEVVDGIDLTTLTDTEVNDNAFSLIIKDSIMEPLFPKETVIICDPDKENS